MASDACRSTRGKAYGETFDVATANLRFETTGVRLDSIDIAKSTGRVTGAAWVAWDGNYSFDADGSRIPVESLVTLSFPRAPLSGLMQFTASGTGTFDSPRYDVQLRVDDLFAADEGIGQVTGRLSLRGELLTMEIDAASPRLTVTGSGRLALTPEMDAELTLRFTRHRSIHISGSSSRSCRHSRRRWPTAPSAPSASSRTSTICVVDATVDSVALKLFDYPVKNDGPIKLSLDRHTLEVQRFRLVGEGTAIELSGNVALHDDRIALEASGDANLGILQGFFRDIRSSGAASLHAQIQGPLDAPGLLRRRDDLRTDASAT